MKDRALRDKRAYLPSLALLRSFECAARHQSFTLAAEELHLTQSAISRQVKELEGALGIALFRRLGRRVALTEAGRVFAEDVAVDLERLRQTTYRAIAAGVTGRSLRIATLPTFAARWLIPRLHLFEAACPGVEVNLATRLGAFDLVKERFDLVIHYGLRDWPDAELTELGREEMVPVAAPGRLPAGVPTTWPLLHLESRPTAWSDWCRLKGLDVPAMLPGKHFDQFTMIIAGAVAGLGVGLLPRYLVDTELADGSLTQVDKTALTTPNAYYVVRPRGARAAHSDGFVRWIQGQFGRP